MDPKEYHLDTAITWCRDNGWPQELLSSCHFYPTIGSVYYLTDHGGPTVVFNQSSSRYGMSPLLPSELAIVHPKANRMLVFKGNLFHGVMKNPLKGNSGRRLTLLINYWRNKTAGERETHTLEMDPLLIERCKYLVELQLRRQRRRIAQKRDMDRDRDIDCLHSDIEQRDDSQRSPSITPFEVVKMDREFHLDMQQWQMQMLPDEYRYHIENFSLNLSMSARLSKPTSASLALPFSLPPLLFKLRSDSLIDRLRRESNGLVKYYHNWPTWTADDSIHSISASELHAPDGGKALEQWRMDMPGGYPYLDIEDGG